MAYRAFIEDANLRPISNPTVYKKEEAYHLKIRLFFLLP